MDVKSLPVDLNKRWESGKEHHPLADKLARLIGEIDFYHCGDYFCFKFGGDGDNGEFLIWILSEIFERNLITKEELLECLGG